MASAPQSNGVTNAYSKAVQIGEPKDPVSGEYDLKTDYDSKNGVPTTAAPKVLLKYFFVNTTTGEKIRRNARSGHPCSRCTGRRITHTPNHPSPVRHKRPAGLFNTTHTLNKYHLSLTQNMYDALISFIYNVGAGNFHRSALLSKVKANPYDRTIAGEFHKWIHSKGKPLAGLQRRRMAEAKLYFTT